MADILIVRRGETVDVAGLVSRPVAATAANWVIAGIGMMLMLLAPAIWNGFPLIFPDTGGYIDRPILGTLGMGRSALYGAFLFLGIASSFWLNIVVQAMLLTWLIVLTLRAHGLGGRPWLALGIVALLTVTTSLPWFTAQLMPDILFPAAVLALHLLIFRDRMLGRAERWALVAVIVFAIPSHMAAAGMCVDIVAAAALLARFPHLGLPDVRLRFAAGAVAAGLALCPVSNYAITGNFALLAGINPGELVALDPVAAAGADHRRPGVQGTPRQVRAPRPLPGARGRRRRGLLPDLRPRCQHVEGHHV